MLDNIEQVQQNDTLGVLAATEKLADQCHQVWDEISTTTLPEDYRQVTNAVVAGMGGSHLGAQLIKSVYRESLKVPLTIQNQYTCPGYVNEKSLVIATSFSGNTEEILSFLAQAAIKKAKIVCISSGGKIEEVAKQNNYPHYSFESTHNPSRIPRYSSGYLFTAQLSFLSKAGIIDFTDGDINQIINAITEQKQKYTLAVQTHHNPAKQLAQSLHGKSVTIVASEHLVGSAYIFKNQLNESAKNFSDLHEIPELNHHLLEGLKFPSTNADHMNFVFFESELYHPRNQKRYQITKEIIKQQGFSVYTFKPTNNTKLTQAFETLAFTSYTALYLSILNQVDPGPNPWVDQLKEAMSQI